MVSMRLKTVLPLFIGLVLSGCGGGGGGEDPTPPILKPTNNAPIANAGEDKTIVLNQSINLSGAASTDSDGDSLSYSWSINEQPDGSAIELSNAASSSISFTPLIAGDYLVHLVVNDGQSDSNVDSVTVSVVGNSEEVTTIPLDASLNILLIIADDIGVDNISAYGEQANFSAQTPTIDQFASQGILFKNTWANPVCSPSRASILTGKHAFRHGVTYPGRTHGVLSNSQQTIAEALATVGYKSALFGKWHLGSNTGELPTDHGFDYYSGSLTNLEDYFDWTKTQVTEKNGLSSSSTQSTYATELVASEAQDWIGQQTTPWFVQLAFNAPHSPFHVPPQNTYANNNITGNVGDSCTNSSADEPKDCYRAAAESMDYYIKQLIDNIPAEQLVKTVIIFVGDNGTPGGVIVEEAGNSFSTVHGKGTVYEGGVNVPMIIWGGGETGVIHSATVVDDLTQIQDIFTTVLAIANVTAFNTTIDGLNLVHYLDDNVTSFNKHQTQYSELTDTNTNIDKWAVSDGAMKYIHNEGVEECYNLEDDASEVNNLYVSAPSEISRCDELKNLKPSF